MGITLDQLTKGNEVDYVYRYCVVGCLLYSRHSGRHVRKLMLRASLLRESLGSEAARCGSLWGALIHCVALESWITFLSLQSPISREQGYSGERSEPGLKAWICVKCLPKSVLAYLEYHPGHGLHYYIIFSVLNAWSALRRKREARIVPRTWAGEHFLRSDKAGLGSCHFSQGDLGRSPSLQTASCMLGKMKWLWHVEG